MEPVFKPVFKPVFPPVDDEEDEDARKTKPGFTPLAGIQGPGIKVGIWYNTAEISLEQEISLE